VAGAVARKKIKDKRKKTKGAVAVAVAVAKTVVERACTNVQYREAVQLL
jgi:hypothetical protein